MKCITVLIATMAMSFAIAQETITECDAKIQELKKQIAELKKVNPNVAYAPKENPSINVYKSMKKTFVNRTFMCPFHKGFSFVEGGRCSGSHDAYGRPLPCKAQVKYQEWERLVNSIPETERIDAEIKKLTNQVKELQSVRLKLPASKESAMPREDSQSNKLTINLKRSSIQKLLREGVLGNNKMKIKLVEE